MCEEQVILFGKFPFQNICIYTLQWHMSQIMRLFPNFFASKNVVAELFLAIIMSAENILFFNICDLVRSARWRKLLCEFCCKIEISVCENISWNICVKVKLGA